MLNLDSFLFVVVMVAHVLVVSNVHVLLLFCVAHGVTWPK